MASFSPFVDLLAEIEDPRRAEGKLYRLPEVVLFAILAIVAGANSYRAIHSFIDVHLAQLRDAFGMRLIAPSCASIFPAASRRAAAVRFMWLQTSSSGFSSGA